jgi:hypothetical protein
MLELNAKVRESEEGCHGGKMEEAGKEELPSSTMSTG